MSRIGKNPVALPKGIEAKVENDRLMIKNSKITRELEIGNKVKAKVENDKIVFSPLGNSKQDRAYWGTFRSLANNIVIGLDKGFQKTLNVNGVGYRSAIKGKILEMQLGFSHPIEFEIPQDIEISVEKNGDIVIKGVDKQKVGQVAAKIRGYRPPEPYKGKGIKYADEHIVRKAGKTAK
jgi:large subunit ribosomal protein L6